jgi:hypothetical protein
VPRVSDRLSPLGDFDDPAARERRLRARLEQEQSDPGRSEVLTQLARVQGLRGDFGGCEELLELAESLAGDEAVARAPIDPEANSEPDPYFHEELAEIYAVLGRKKEAREQTELGARLR